MKYDFLIVGAGLYGAVFAHEAAARCKRCLVLEKRPHVAGNAYTENVGGIEVHRCGAHIFHTDKREIWDYVNRFAEFEPFVNSPIAIFENEVYNLPFNMNTFSRLWGVKTPEQAREMIERQRSENGITEPKNLEEQALFTVGRDIYEKLIKGYTEKQWGRSCKELPAEIIGRLPLRFSYDNNYFTDRFQGVPKGGYTRLVKRLLEGCEVLLNTDYFEFIKAHPNVAETTVYSGMIDRFFDYRYGALEYRSLRFEDARYETENFQGNAVINYTSSEIPYTRSIEHRFFDRDCKANFTIVTREYPQASGQGAEPFYPVNDAANNARYEKYRALANELKDVIFGGRLGRYKYYDMDDVIELALKEIRN